MLCHARSRNVDVDWTFYATIPGTGALESRALDCGAKLIRSPVTVASTLEFARALRRESQRGSYDVIHCHHDFINAVYLLSVIGAPIATRICHVHNADEALPTASVLKRRLYKEPMRRTCLKLADKIVGISEHTLDTFLAGRPRRPGRDVVHYYGVDSARFEHLNGERAQFREANRISLDAPVLLFAGRIVPEKNPLFAVDVLDRLLRINPAVVGVFAGAGSQSDAVAARAGELGISGSVRMIGWRNDLPAVMSAADCFILPHPETHIEGFGLAVAEAQLAGLPLLLSMGVPTDPLLPSAIFRRLPLSDGPDKWALAADTLLGSERPSRDTAIRELRNSPMDMDRALDLLLAIHEA